MVSCYDLG